MLVYLVLLIIISLPILIPTLIVGTIIHFVNKKKRREQMVEYELYKIQQSQQAVQMNAYAETAQEETPQFSAPEQPVYQMPVQPLKEKKHREPVSSSTLMLLIGTALVVLSGIAFGAANWLNTTPFGRVAIILTASIAAFIISLIFGKTVKLKGTSTAFYIVGSLMIPIAMIIAGFYDLLGGWFSVLGNGRYLLYAVSFGIVSASCFIGSKIYIAKHFVYSGLTTLSISMLFLALQTGFLTGSMEAGIYCTVLILMQAFITAAIHIFKLHEKTSIAAPLKTVGTVTSFVYGFIGVLYTFSSAYDATFATYFIIVAVILQLIAYGIIKKQNWMMGVQSFLSVCLAIMISVNRANDVPDYKAILLCAYLFTAVYFINAIIPQLRNHFSTMLTLTTVFFGGCMTLGCMSDLTPVIAMIVPMVFTVIIYTYIFNEDKKTQFAAGLISPLMPCIIGFSIENYISGNAAFSYTTEHAYRGFIYITVAAILIGITALIHYLPKFAFSFHANHPRKTDAVLYSGMAAALLLLILSAESPILIVIPIIITAAHFFIANQFRNNILTVGSVVAFIGYFVNCMNRLTLTVTEETILCFFVFLAVMGLSRFFYRNAVVYKNNEKVTFDAPFLAGWILFPYIFSGAECSDFFGLLTIAIYMACCIKKNTSETASCGILSGSAIFTAAALISRPFLVPDSQIISNKITFAIIALVGIAFRVIWRKHEHGAKLSSNIIFICTFAALMLDALYFDNAGNTVFVLAVTTAILLASFMLRSKTWFSVSSIAIALIILYAAKDFLASLSGWVYLFAAGLILIGAAAVNEYCKQHGENMKSKLAHAFSDWEW